MFTRVTISGHVLTPDGTAPVSGRITAKLSTSGSTLDGGESVKVATETTADLGTGGAVSLALAPNDAITPSGTYYLVTFIVSLANGRRAQWAERWQLTSADLTLDIGAVPRLDAVPGLSVAPYYVPGDASAMVVTATGAAAAHTLADHLATLPDAAPVATGDPFVTRPMGDWAATAPIGSAWKLHALLTKLAQWATTSPVQLRVMGSGDSMAADIQRATTDRLAKALGEGRGIVGYADQVGLDTSRVVVESGGAIVTDTAYSLGGLHAELAAGEAVKFWIGGQHVRATEIKILFYRGPGQGTFDIQTEILTAPGVWTTQASGVSAVAASAGTGTSTVSLAANNYRVRVLGATGTVRITGFEFVSADRSGVVDQKLQYGGATFTQWLETPTAVMTEWIAAVAPDLVLMENKEEATSLPVTLPQVLDWFEVGAPTADMVVIGSTPDSADADMRAENDITRAEVLSRGWTYWDAHQLFGSYEEAVARGWMADATHPNALGKAVKADYFWHEMIAGLGSLPEPRPVRGDSVITKALTFRGGNDTAATMAGTIETDSLGTEVNITPEVKLRFLDPATGLSYAELNAPGNFANTANKLPPFRSTNINGTAGPWLRCATDGVAMMVSSNANGGNGDLAPLKVSKLYGMTWTALAANTDIAGSLTLDGTGTATYTFTGTYAGAPIVVATDTTAIAPVRVQVTTTTITITGTAGHVVNYIAVARY